MRIKKSLFLSACAWTLVVPEPALASGPSIAGSHGGIAHGDATLATLRATFDSPSSSSTGPATSTPPTASTPSRQGRST